MDPYACRGEALTWETQAPLPFVMARLSSGDPNPLPISLWMTVKLEFRIIRN
jgi:hypothetical protein